jgi:hypothetical protein
MGTDPRGVGVGDVLFLEQFFDGRRFLGVLAPAAHHLVHVLVVGHEAHLVTHLALGLRK